MPSTQRGDRAASDRAQPTRKEDGASREAERAPYRAMENQTLEGRVALVAGASRAAGRGIAVELGAAGATVHFVPEVQDAGKPADTTGDR